MVKKSPQIIYSNKQYKLTEYPKFLYEVSLYKIWKDRAECIGNQFYAADTPITIKKETTSKKELDYRLVKYITWLAAPLDYMLSNGFTLYNETNRSRKSSGSKSATIQGSRGNRNVKGKS